KLESNSNHNSIIGNNASDNDKNGIRLYGTSGNPSSHNTVANNTADLNAKSGIIIEGADSDYNTIVNNTCKSNDYGIYVKYGDYNNLTKNTCNQNTVYGIRLYRSADNNEITNNTAISNTEYGIYISSSNYNIIYNNYFNNTNNAYDDGNNVWNTTKTLGTNIIGGLYLGGNYWSDYAGRDLNGDGLGDTLLPYNSSGDITNDGDYHPLVPVGYAPVLSIEKTDNPDPVSPNGTLNYSIRVNNTGYANATNVTVMETYDKNVTFVAAVPKPSSGDDTWQFPTLNVSETRWINVSVIVNASVLNRTALHNIVNVSCAEGVTNFTTNATTVSAGYAPPEITYFAPLSPVNDTVDAWRTFNVTVNQTVDIEWYLDDSLNPTNNSVREASFTLQAVEGEHNVTATASNVNGSDSHSWVWNVKSISVTKLGDVTVAVPSTLVNFSINVSNIGDSNLTQVVVNDMLPEGMTFSRSDPDPNTTQDGMDITWYFNESLAVNHSETITLVARIAENATGVLTNTVDVTGTTENGTNVSASATAQVRVIRLAIEKSCKSTTSLGKTVKYTITYSNPNEVDLTNVVITENYPKDLTFISAVPAPDPGTNNKWTIGTLPAKESGKITIKMKVPASMTDFSYTESGSVSGEGIVMISKELSTKVEPFDLENIVTISGSYKETNVSATASAITTVSVSGSSLEITEHGSGTYESEEELSVSPEKMGIKFDKTTNAEYSPTTFKCSDGFVMEVPSKWSQDICIKNYVKKSAIHKTITEATYMNDNTIIKSDNKCYSMDFDSSFLGYLHVDKKTTDAATSEHYIGKFVIKDWDQSGKEIVDGVGYVIVDKELSSGRLLLMEHGSGYYLSEEDSSSNSIKKITIAEYKPTSFNFSDGFVVNFSSKWMQDVCARSGTGTSALHKKIRDATYIDDDTTARSSPSLIFHTFFYGATHVGSKSRYSKASEDYIGDFYISWGASGIFIFDWGDVPGLDDDDLIDYLSKPKFNMSWVTDDDIKITKSSKKDKITIATPEHSAEIILDTKTYESAELIVDGVDTYTFNVVKHGKTLKVYDPEFKRKPEVVSGEGFVMVDEAIFQDGEIEVTEHGSGIYHSDEDFNSKKLIEKSTYGEYKPSYFSFSDSFAVNFSSLWMQDICAKDKKEGTAIHKKISDAALMKDDTIAAKSLMNITSSFNGSMHIGVRTENVSISEDYIGEFNVTERIKIVKGKPPKSSSESPDWLFCPCPISSSTYLWFCQDPTYRGR
ncbi:MAG: NosD domain-containing protein, partial [Euryarchaeota archaeon]|nr:NosD domain-containing protein [Euryarchaeota archaeon]